MERTEAWRITELWQEFEGEGRAATVRLVGICLFYAVELLNFHGLSFGPIQLPVVVDSGFHSAATMLAVGWSLVSALVFFHLRVGLFPSSLKYLSTGLDFVFLTGMLVLADGPKSPLTPVYFLLLGLIALRMSLPLVWFGTACAMLSYLSLSVYASYVPDKSVPAYHSILFVTALFAMGAISGQLVRRYRATAEALLERSAQ